jgi:hypothetical protein
MWFHRLDDVNEALGEHFEAAAKRDVKRREDRRVVAVSFAGNLTTAMDLLRLTTIHERLDALEELVQA